VTAEFTRRRGQSRRGADDGAAGAAAEGGRFMGGVSN
jgi:hypothetical protein